jgi:hypothetical protein
MGNSGRKEVMNEGLIQICRGVVGEVAIKRNWMCFGRGREEVMKSMVVVFKSFFEVGER